ncbi:MAG: type II secretion system protein [Betaproteobacteria bacterium]
MRLTKRGMGGVSLVELIVFIVIVSVSVAGVLLAINTATRSGTDPMIRKNAIAIAEGMLEEVSLMPFTFCDADDPQVTTATSSAVGAAGCTSAATVNAIGPEAGETRYASATPFDHVDDYSGFSMNPIVDITNTAIGTLTSYSATVSVAATALGSIAATDAQGQANALLITVTVSGPQNTTVVLQGYRTKHAPQI